MASWIDHILHRNCFLQHIIEERVDGKIEVMGRWGRRRHKWLLDDLKDKIGYWKLKEATLEHGLWRTRFGKACGSVIWQTTIHTHTEGVVHKVGETSGYYMISNFD